MLQTWMWQATSYGSATDGLGDKGPEYVECPLCTLPFKRRVRPACRGICPTRPYPYPQQSPLQATHVFPHPSWPPAEASLSLCRVAAGASFSQGLRRHLSVCRRTHAASAAALEDESDDDCYGT